jgi:hypothetical protein
MAGQAEPRSDIFSVGATMLHLLTGQPCNLMALALCENEGLPHLPEGLSEIVAKAIEFKAAKRYASAREMAVALDRWLVQWGHRHRMSSARLSFSASDRKSTIPLPRRSNNIWPIAVAAAVTGALWAGISLGQKTQPGPELSKPKAAVARRVLRPRPKKKPPLTQTGHKLVTFR